MSKLEYQDHKIVKSNPILSNSVWALMSNLAQNLLVSVFFIIIARQYSTDEFGNYVVANTIYSLVLGFSSLGLGHWFIREIVNDEGKKLTLINKFFKMQIYIGIAFMIINVIMTVLLYNNELVRSLSIIFGVNIIFDNVINALKYLNLANENQKTTFVLLVVEAFLKFLVALVVVFYPMSILWLSLILLLLRFVTLNLFLRIGSGGQILVKDLYKTAVNIQEFKQIVLKNWPFVIISSLSIINWRIGNVIVSKVLTLKEVSDFEVSFKLLSMAYLVPVVVATTLYPRLLKAYQLGTGSLASIYRVFNIIFVAYGMLSYSIVITFSNDLIPLIFGAKFIGTYQYCNEIFLVMLVFPSIFLQANILLVLKLEKKDMLMNIVGVTVNVLICLIGLRYYKSLSVVNYAIFSSMLVFHILQDIVVARKKITDIYHILMFYGLIVLVYFYFSFAALYKLQYFAFAVFWLIVFSAVVLNYKRILGYFKTQA